MKEELNSKMHSEFIIDSETEISHRVAGIVQDLKDSDFSLDELLKQYNITKSQYNKHRHKWE